MEGPAFLDGLVGTITGILSGGYARMSDDLKRILSLVVGLDLMAASFAWMMASLGIFHAFVMHLLKMFVFVMLFTSLPVLTQAFIEYCIWGGLEAGGMASGGQLSVAEFQRPSTVIMKGFEATAPINTFIEGHTGWAAMWNFHTLTMMSVGAMGIWLAFVVMSFYLVFAQILLYAVAAYMVIFIVFGALSATSFLAERAIGVFIASAARLGVAAMLTALMFPFIDGFFLKAAPTDPDVYVGAWLLVGSWLITFLVWAVSSIVHGFFAGGPMLSFSNAVPGVSMVRMISSHARGGSGSHAPATPRQPIA